MSSWRDAFKPLLLVLVFSSASAPIASAQGDEDFRSTAAMRLGGLYVTPTIRLTNFGIDTNVFNENDSEEPSSDFTVSLSPSTDIWLPFTRRALWKTTATAGLDYYQKFSGERSVNPNVQSRFTVFMNRLTLFAGGNYLNTRQRPNFEIDVRSRRRVDGVDAGLELEVMSKLFVQASGRYGRIRYDADAFFLGTSLAETLNRDERVGRLAVEWRRNALTTIVFAAEAETARFQLSPDRNADSVAATVGVELGSRALISGSAHLGFRQFDGLSATLPDFTGIIASAAVSYTLSGSTVFAYSAERDLEYSFEEVTPYYIQTGHGLDVTRHLGGSFDVTGGVQRYSYAYRRFDQERSRAVGDRVDETWNYRASVAYRVNRETRVGIGVSYFDRRSGRGAAQNYSGLRAGVTMSYGS